MALALEGGAPRPARRLAVTRVFLVRHGHAGDREAWNGPDDKRPLSPKGWRQARGLVPLLAAEAFDRIVSSPAVRCVETVEPLAEARALAVARDERLLEGHDAADTFRWLAAEAAAGSLVACTHGDLVPALLALASASGSPMPTEPRWAKGSTWVLDAEAGQWVGARYLPPPS